MVADACALASQAGIDFSNYDSDNDGVVDNVFVFFAGEDEAEGADENSIWSHSWYLFHGAGMSLELNGKMIDRYACSSEMTRVQDIATGKLIETHLSGIGTFCHEFSHTFGLPDLYDTDYEETNGWASGLWGSTSLMDSGNQNNNGNTPPNFNAIEREILNLSGAFTIENDGKYSLSPINKGGEFFRIDTDVENEYYLLECRSSEAGTWDEYIGGSGMLVYHIDKSEANFDKWQIYNTLNADPNHQCADLIEADGRSDAYTDYMDYLTRQKNLDGIFFPYFNTNSLPAQGVPGLNFWSGANENLSVINIEKDQSGKVTFNVIGFTEDSTPPSVSGNIEYEAFCDGAILKFESDRPHDGVAVLTYKSVGEEEKEISVLPYEEGRYAVMLEGLKSVKTYTVSVHFVHNDIKGSATSVSFMTKKQPAVSWPYISLGARKATRASEFMAMDHLEDNRGRFEAGSRIPFKINNTNGVKDILWFFNGQPVTHEGDYYYTLNESGTLEAHLYMDDGQEYILIKQINIE
jgi:M6 family metalloprotease-like protein